MTIKELQDEILRLKKEKNFCILAHSYMSPEIQEIADIRGDSFKLSVDAANVSNKNLIMCGVRFMAECAKLLSPDKHVFLSNPYAGCPMAEQLSPETIINFKNEHPDYAVVAYVNTTAELKTLADVCVTSSSAVKIVSKLPQKNILFIPDKNLGKYVAEKVPEKNIALLNGFCPIHNAVSESDAITAKQNHPNAKLLVHPECKPEVLKHADYIGSTSGIINYAANSSDSEFIIGTENKVLEFLQLQHPDKTFYHLSEKLVCVNMNLTTLTDIYKILSGSRTDEIVLDDDTALKARASIDRMIALGKGN